MRTEEKTIINQDNINQVTIDADVEIDIESTQLINKDDSVEIDIDETLVEVAEKLNAVEPSSGEEPINTAPDPSVSGRFQDAQAFTFESGDMMEGRDMMHANGLSDTDITRTNITTIEDETSDFMMMLANQKQSSTASAGDYEFRDITGANNNLDNIDWGSTNKPFASVAGLQYGDNISTPNDIDRPNVRDISNTIFAQDGDLFSNVGSSNILWVWGQFVDHDITFTQEAHDEAYDIEIPIGDAHFDPFNTGQATMHFERSAVAEGTGTDADNPRAHVNTITSFVDASNVYGSSEELQLSLRAEGGKMLVSGDNLLPLTQGDHGPEFLAGDGRANENVGLTGMHTIFMREHNRLVDLLSEENPEMSDEQLYQTAKMVVEAQMQKITYDEFLTKLLGEDALDAYEGYDSTVDPRIATEFSTAAFRVGHTMLSSDIFRMGEDGSESEFGHLTLQEAFFRPDLIMNQGGIDEALRGLSGSGSQQIDNHIIDDVRNFLFGPPGAGGFDLVSLNIQRGRDHGISDFNTVREAYGLDPIEDFNALTDNVDLAQRLTDLYGDISHLDLWVGGLIEDPHGDGLVGETFHTIITQQFTNLRDGDRFWYEGRLDADLLDMVENSSLSDIIARNSDIDYLQNDVFSTNNRIGGGEGDDVVNGTDGSDLLIGFDGNDIINGGAGRDELYGGNGADIFEFSANDLNDGADVIGDFDGLNGDRLNLGDILGGFDPANDVLADFVQTETSDDGVMVQVVANNEATNLVFIENIQNFDLDWINTDIAIA